MMSLPLMVSMVSALAFASAALAAAPWRQTSGEGAGALFQNFEKAK